MAPTSTVHHRRLWVRMPHVLSLVRTFGLLVLLTACKSPSAGNIEEGGEGNIMVLPAHTTTQPGNANGTTDPAMDPAHLPAATGVMETIHFMGRFVADDRGQLFAWSGAQISAQFQGSAIAVTLDELDEASATGGNMYDVSVDGSASTVLTAQLGGGTYTLASGLGAGLHTVSVQKRTEASVGTARFRGFTVTGGQLVPKASNVTRRMLMIGDSITCGYGILGTSSSCSFTTPTEDAALTYGAVAAGNKGADIQLTSWSGKGIYRNNDATTTQTMGQCFNLVIPTDPNTVFDWSSFVPDAIVINLGTNDFSATNVMPDEQSFTAAYSAMLLTLTRVYPNAHVFVVLGPMLIDNYPVGTTYLTTARAYLQAVVATANNNNVSMLELTSLTDTQKGCDSHPNVAAHALMAQALEAALTSALSW